MSSARCRGSPGGRSGAAGRAALTGVGAGPSGAVSPDVHRGGSASDGFTPWYSQERFEEEFRGTRDDLVARYRDLAARFAGCDPVLDLGCGRGELLELLAGPGVDAWGVIDAELVAVATGRGFRVSHAEVVGALARLDGDTLGGLVMVQVVEHLSAQ